MNSVTPALSAALSLQPQQTSLNARTDLKIDDKTAPQTTSSGNSTVTLSESAVALSQETLQLSANQTIRQIQSAELLATENNETTSGLTYASALKKQARTTDNP